MNQKKKNRPNLVQKIDLENKNIPRQQVIEKINLKDMENRGIELKKTINIFKKKD